jgi:hypothetical protein
MIYIRPHKKTANLFSALFLFALNLDINKLYYALNPAHILDCAWPLAWSLPTLHLQILQA